MSQHPFPDRWERTRGQQKEQKPPSSCLDCCCFLQFPLYQDHHRHPSSHSCCHFHFHLCSLVSSVMCDVYVLFLTTQEERKVFKLSTFFFIIISYSGLKGDEDREKSWSLSSQGRKGSKIGLWTSFLFWLCERNELPIIIFLKESEKADRRANHCFHLRFPPLVFWSIGHLTIWFSLFRKRLQSHPFHICHSCRENYTERRWGWWEASGLRFLHPKKFFPSRCIRLILIFLPHQSSSIRGERMK